MDSGEDIEYKISIKKHLSGNIVLAIDCEDRISSSVLFPNDVGLGLEHLGIVMRRDFDKNHN